MNLIKFSLLNAVLVATSAFATTNMEVKIATPTKEYIFPVMHLENGLIATSELDGLVLQVKALENNEMHETLILFDLNIVDSKGSLVPVENREFMFTDAVTEGGWGNTNGLSFVVKSDRN